jgi:hypothetical protein
VLNLIFNRLNFHGHLRLSLVCRRFLKVIENDVLFMRTVKFKAYQSGLQWSQNPPAKLMRKYKVVDLIGYSRFEELADLEMVECVETLNFKECYFHNPSEFVSFLKHCKQLKSVGIEILVFDFEDDASEPMEKFQSPVTIATGACSYAILNCFENILQICVSWVQYLATQEFARCLNQHAEVFVSIKLFEHDFEQIAEQLVGIPKLELKRMDLSFETQRNLMATAQLFAHQSSSLTTLLLEGNIQQPIIDLICSNLVNLEQITLVTMNPISNISWNQLKDLPKLKSLSVNFCHSVSDFVVDFGEMLSLEQLDLVASYSFRDLKLVWKGPNKTLKKLKLGLLIDNHILGQIAEVFPNLTDLDLSGYVNVQQ